MSSIPESLESLINSFSQLPGIGKKTAKRLSLFILKEDFSIAKDLSSSLIDVKEKITFCKKCNNFTETDFCLICDDESRNHSLMCVVENPSDILLFEKIGYKGIYHVLGGLLSPLDGIGPEDLKINMLIDRLDNVNEIIVATSASVEGDATALYLSRIIKNLSIKVTRLSRGLPMGGDLDYIDELTLDRSLSDRKVIE